MINEYLQFAKKYKYFPIYIDMSILSMDINFLTNDVVEIDCLFAIYKQRDYFCKIRVEKCYRKVIGYPINERKSMIIQNYEELFPYIHLKDALIESEKFSQVEDQNGEKKICLEVSYSLGNNFHYFIEITEYK